MWILEAEGMLLEGVSDLYIWIDLKNEILSKGQVKQAGRWGVINDAPSEHMQDFEQRPPGAVNKKRRVAARLY